MSRPKSHPLDSTRLCRPLTDHPNVDYLMGVASCFLWFLGFVLLSHWHIYAINDRASIGFAGTLLKLVAAVFFNMQPITAIWDETATATAAVGSDSGLTWNNVSPGEAYKYARRMDLGKFDCINMRKLRRYMFGWSNLTGICLFHAGNMLSVFHMMRPSSDLFKCESFLP